MDDNNKTNEKKGFFKKLIDDVAENVKEGASFVSGKVAETSAKAYVASTELVSETSDKIHDFTEKQALHKEEHKLEARQIALKHQFGVISFDHFLQNDSLHKPFLTSQPVMDIVAEFKANSERIEKITNQVKELENH